MKKIPQNLLCVLCLSILLTFVFNAFAVCNGPQDVPIITPGEGPAPKPTPKPTPTSPK